jgi:predicted alpha-1,2-mannosidase
MLFRIKKRGPQRLIVVLAVSILLFSCKEQTAHRSGDVLNEVNMFIGTGGNGRIIPVAVAPRGMVQLGPDTRRGGSGYHYSNPTILGFSHTHKSGGGCGDFLDILLQPTAGELMLEPGEEASPGTGYRSAFSHEEEYASPGRYRVRLADYDIEVTLTATKRCGFHRYEFPEGKDSHIILDLIHGNTHACTIVKEDGGDSTIAASVRILDDRRIEGFKISEGWSEEMHAYFAMEFSQPFSGHGIQDEIAGEYLYGAGEVSSKQIRAHFDFDLEEDRVVLVKAGISPVSTENAWANLRAEIPGWEFREAVETVQDSWRQELERVRVKGGTPAERELFITGLYNVLVYPMLYMDVNGQYRGPDHKVHRAEGYEHYAGYIGTWDVFRAANPLLTLIRPDAANDYVKTMLAHYEICGLLPVWVLAGDEDLTMQGFHSVPMIADTYYKGIRDYDAEKVYRAILASAMKDTFGYCMRRFVGLKNYKEYGYVPADLEYESVAKTLEYAYDDWTVAQMAEMLGHRDDYEYFMERALSYRKVFDTNANFMRGRMSDGSWRTPFDPFYSFHRRDDFMEGTAWQWTFFVPHDPVGLAGLMGGEEMFIGKLDSLFAAEPLIRKQDYKGSGDISGMIGQYAHGNEVSQHIAYFYNYFGQPWKTQEWVNQIRNTLYNTTPDGYCGNEDTGQMSAWYVFSCMGFYPVTHGQGVYVIGTPAFERIKFEHGFGGTLTIRADNAGGENIYIQSVKLDGRDYTKNWFRHEDLFNGDEVTIEFQMGDRPNHGWGSGAADRPPGMSGS